jgi:prefoldin subunit 1
MAQQQIGQAKQQIGSKQREMRMVRLTMNEIESLPAGSNVYEGVGKM